MTKGPQTEAGDNLHAMKYRSKGENFEEAGNRMAFGLRDTDAHYHALRDIFLSMRFMPGGRIQSATGATRQVTPYNCFVSGMIADSFVEGPGSIMDRVKEAAATMRQGGGIGYDFSTLRPRGFPIRKLESHSSGPISFMRIFNEVCLATSSSGHRRGAQMGVLRVDHPDIEEFIHAKQNKDQFTGFNFSIAVTDEFMEAALNEKPFTLRWGGVEAKEIDAAVLWEKIMRSTWDWAEPGVLFIDRINKMNNLYYCETIAATNPCGEQPLPPYGACLLGSFNLVKYLRKQPDAAIAQVASPYYFDFPQLEADIPHVVRAMDNVVDRARYPLPAQKGEAITKRRMGLGITGLANTLEALGTVYGETEFIDFQRRIQAFITNKVYQASAELAKEKGSFPLYDAEKYLAGAFIHTLDPETIEAIARNGIRNSHLTSIAPTGTISMAADNVSSGLEPVFTYTMKRPINTPDGQMMVEANDYGFQFLGVKGKLAKNVTATEHVDVLLTAQRYTDSAVSKTVNMDGAVMPWADFKAIYARAWEGGAKGCATYNVSGKRQGLLIEGGGADSCTIDTETGRRSCE